MTKNISLSLTYEHYDMFGVGGNQAPSAAYPTANMWTMGMNFRF
jgi:hypothetical protein